jgi:DNA-binding MarR family transcriptional regulator
MAETTLLYLVKQLELAIRTRLDAVVSGGGLTVQQYTAMTVLERTPGLTAAELARNSFVRAQTMAEVISELEQRQLIGREPDPRNQRRYLTTLTDRGAALLDSLRPAVEAVEAGMTARLSAKEVGDLRRLLRSCRETLAGSTAH